MSGLVSNMDEAWPLLCQFYPMTLHLLQLAFVDNQLPVHSGTVALPQQIPCKAQHTAGLDYVWAQAFFFQILLILAATRPEAHAPSHPCTWLQCQDRTAKESYL